MNYDVVAMTETLLSKAKGSTILESEIQHVQDVET